MSEGAKNQQKKRPHERFKRLYVGCGLTRSPEVFKHEVENLKAILRKEWEVLDFLGLVNGTPVDVYRRDIIENVGGCDAFLAIVDEPSFGVGWEAREAVLRGKPVLMVAHENSKVTRLLIGATNFYSNLTFRTYSNMIQEVPELLRLETKRMWGQQQ